MISLKITWWKWQDGERQRTETIAQIGGEGQGPGRWEVRVEERVLGWVIRERVPARKYNWAGNVMPQDGWDARWAWVVEAKGLGINLRTFETRKDAVGMLVSRACQPHGQKPPPSRQSQFPARTVGLRLRYSYRDIVGRGAKERTP